MADVNTAPIDRYLRVLADHKGTDLHITAGAPPLLRVDGQMRPISEPPFNPDATERLVREVLPADLWERCLAQKEVDFAFDWAGAYRLRGNVFHTRTSVAMALRLIPYEIPGFGELGIPPTVIGWCDLFQGLVLVTGPRPWKRSQDRKSTRLNSR